VFSNSDTSLVSVYDGLNYKLSAITQDDSSGGAKETILQLTPVPEVKQGQLVFWIFVKVDGAWRSSVGISGKTYFCRDMKKERIEEMVVMTSYTMAKPSVPYRIADQPPTIEISNQGCYAWIGTVTTTASLTGSKYFVQVEWERDIQAKSVTLNPIVFDVKNAFVDWTAAFTDGQCKSSGSGAWHLNKNNIRGGKLIFDLDILSGQRFRSGIAGASGGIDPIITEVCTDPYTGKTVTTKHSDSDTWIDSADQSEPPQVPKLSSDGKKLTGTFKFEDRVTTLELDAIRE
jgi:hypothetical protein